MNILVFFSVAESLVKYCQYLNLEETSNERYTFISTKVLDEADAELLAESDIEYVENENLNDALSCGAGLINDEEHTIIASDSVIPVDSYAKHITQNLEQFPDMAVAFGRRYNSVIAGRHNIEKLGFKYIDATPKLIAPHIIDHTPSFDSHAKQVSRFPVFFNWFSSDVSSVLKSALEHGTSLSEMSLFFCDYLQHLSPDRKMYYLPEIEVIDKKLL